MQNEENKTRKPFCNLHFAIFILNCAEGVWPFVLRSNETQVPLRVLPAP